MISGLFPDKKTAENISSFGIPAEAQSQFQQAPELLLLGKTEDALHCFQHAVEIAPNYTEALHETGSCLQNLGRHEEARVYYTRALQEIADRLCEIGRYEESLGRYWVAIRRYEEASNYYQPESVPDPVFKGAHPKKTQDYPTVHTDDSEVH